MKGKDYRATATLQYDGNKYVVWGDYTDQEDHGGIIYHWTEGNYSCDCNRSRFIRWCADPDFPEMSCGDEITMESLDITEIGEMRRGKE